MNKKMVTTLVALMSLTGCSSKIEDAVRAKLKVPSSAKFETTLRYENRACVVFDAKNPLGVYTGASTAELVNLAADGKGDNWIVESVDDSICSDIDLQRRAGIDHQNKDSETAVFKALQNAKLIAPSTSDIDQVAFGHVQCSPFVADLLSQSRLAHSELNPDKKADFEKKYEGGLAQINRGMCRYENGTWVTNVSKSKIDDSETVVLDLTSPDAITVHLDATFPRLILRCAQGEASVFINWDAYLGLNETSVLTRLDKEPAQTSTWSLSTDNKSTFAPGNGADFIKDLLSHKVLVAQVTPYDESPVTVSFPLEGLDNAVKPLQEDCKL